MPALLNRQLQQESQFSEIQANKLFAHRPDKNRALLNLGMILPP